MSEPLNNLKAIEDLGFKLVSFKVTPSSIRGRGLDAFWMLEKIDPAATFVPRFNLCVGETEAGPWHKVLSVPTTDGSVIGVSHELFSHRPGRFVRLVVINESDQPIYATDPMDPTHQMGSKDYLEYREQLRLENLALVKQTGTPGYLFKRIITECACDCADEILGGAFDSQCPNCYGTGKVGGYHPPVRMLADWSGNPKGTADKQKEDKVGITEVEKRLIKTMPFPHAAYKDIWADAISDVRYEVVTVDPVLYKIFPTAQRILLSLLPKSDPAYKLQVPVE